MFFGKKNKYYDVKRAVRNERGTLVVQYVCSCEDFHKDGRNGCHHTFAEQIIRKEVTVMSKFYQAGRNRLRRDVVRPVPE